MPDATLYSHFLAAGKVHLVQITSSLAHYFFILSVHCFDVSCLVRSFVILKKRLISWISDMAVEADDLGFDIVDNSDIAADVELEEEVGDERVEGNKNIPKRGKDIDWVKIAIFDNVEEFKASEPYNDLKNFSVKNSWKAVHAEVEVFTCKHARRAKWKRCGRMMKLEYSTRDQGVVVFDNQCDHHHEVDVTNIRGAGKKYIWTPHQEEIMLPLVKARSTAKVILRELEAQGASDRHGNFPTLLQLNTKKNYMFKTQVMEELSICDTADLRILIEERSQVPDDPHQPFVCAYKIDDSDPAGRPRFTVTFSTKNMLSLINRWKIKTTMRFWH